MNYPEYYRTILEYVAGDTLVLTANRRLARHLTRLHAKEETRKGSRAWPVPAIFSVETWFERQLDLLGEDWRIPGPTLNLHLWEQAVRSDAESSGSLLLQVVASAREAMKANELLADYRIDLKGMPLTEDHQAFLRWRRLYRRLCRNGNWLDPAETVDLLIRAHETNQLPPPASILLVGFDDVPPRLRRLTEVLLTRGCTVRELPSPTAQSGRPIRVAARDAAEEVRSAARWARYRLEQHPCRIGIVAPDLRAYRSLVERLFLEELDPPAMTAVSDEEIRFGLSLGTSLASQGPVAAALAVLACSREATLDEISLMVRSPYLGGGVGEGDRRGMFDRYLRSLRQNSFSWSSLVRLAEGGEGKVPPQLVRIFEILERASKDGRRVLPGAWGEFFRDLLNEVGWPGDRAPDSREFQVVRSWHEKLLPSFIALDAVSAPLGRREAAALLGRLARDLEFQAEMPDGGIQVCGVLEAAGLDFDHLWILGLHENAWPAPARPNPFLPVALQVAYQMPHADAGREALFSRRVMARLQAAAPEVVCSHPQQEGDCALGPSPLIADLPVEVPALAPFRGPSRVIGDQASPLPELVDEVGPSLGPDPAPGGTGILKDQALCPFRAFAHHRLRVRAFDTPAPGLDAATRGTLVHAMLEQFWQAVRSRKALADLKEAERRSAISRAVAEGMEIFFAAHPPRPPEVLLALEGERLEKLLDEWMTGVELGRPDFELEETEGERVCQFGGLTIRTRIDRIDRLEDGRFLVIDYKTGPVRVDDLLTDRPLEPQLPAYAVSMPPATLAGIAIGRLHRGECTLRGLAREEGMLEAVAAFGQSRDAARSGLDSWEALMERWREGLDRLGSEFALGMARVAPVEEQKACRTCDLASLCRIGEASRPPVGEGEEEA